MVSFDENVKGKTKGHGGSRATGMLNELSVMALQGTELMFMKKM